MYDENPKRYAHKLETIRLQPTEQLQTCGYSSGVESLGRLSNAIGPIETHRIFPSALFHRMRRGRNDCRNEITILFYCSLFSSETTQFRAGSLALRALVTFSKSKHVGHCEAHPPHTGSHSGPENQARDTDQRRYSPS
eukprot:926395-Prorocentrum_minimum.AAC.4